MAFVMEFGTGFELGQMPLRAGVWSANVVLGTSGAHTGGYYVSTFGLGRYWRYIRPVPSAELYVSFWLRYGVVTPSANSFLLQDSAGSTLIGLRRNGNYLDVYVGSANVASGGVAFDNDWHHVQLHALIDNASGVVETIIDGIPDCNYSGDTQPGSETDIARLYAGRQTGVEGDYDDICWGSGGWPGDIRFDAVLLDGDDTQEWTPSEGTDHYALLDEVPASTDDFVSTIVDASDVYTLAPWDDTDGEGNVVKDPIAVTLWASARKEDGNHNDLLRLNMQDGVNSVAGDAETLLTNYENRWFFQVAAPDGGAWTKTKIDALLVGIDAEMET